MSKVLIQYGDFATGAKENFVPTISEQESFSNVEQIRESGLSFPNYTNPIELYSTILDGGALALPSNTQGENIGIWSEQISQEDGSFETPISLSLNASEYFTSSGITLEFDVQNNTFPKNVNIKWYRGAEVVSEKEFETTSAYHFFANVVEFFDRVVFTFYNLNMPLTRLKIRSVEYGRRVEFEGSDLSNLRISSKINPISAEVMISTADFVVNTKKDIDFRFQERQPINILLDEHLLSYVFVKTSKRKGKGVWSVQAEDYIGVMDSIQFYGGIYENKNAVELLGEIFQTANIPFDISSEFSNVSVTGHIPFSTCRDALKQVLFAIGAVALTSGTSYVRVVKLSDTVSQYVPLNRVFQGQTVKEDTRVTAVSVTAHSYRMITENVTAYEADKSGMGEGVFVKFSQPLHSLQITNGTILESGANYAVINASSGCVLKGNKYEHSTSVRTKKNPLLLKTDTENIKSVSNATLVSASNVDNVLERCYNYYMQTQSLTSKIVEADKAINVGDKISVQTEFLGDIEGIVAEQGYSLVGSSVVKKNVLRA